MSAKQQLEKYLDMELPTERLLFHVAMILSLTECFVLVLFALLLRMDFKVPALLALGALLTMAAMYAEGRFWRIEWISVVYLVLVHMLIVPLSSCYVSYAIYDYPVYFLTGIAFAVILLKNKMAVFFIVAQMAVDYICIYHMMPEASMASGTYEGNTQYGTVLFCRIMVAFFITGTVCGLLISCRNRILHKEIEKSAAMEQQAEQLSYAQNMFLVNVSHEIRTPLNAILGITELLFDHNTDDRMKENSFHLSNSCRALLAITNELMDFSKLDNNDLTVSDRAYSIGDICNELINVVSVRFADYKTELFVNVDTNIPAQLCGDEAMIRQVMLNLLTGVMKSLESGEVYLDLRCEGGADEWTHLLVEVRAEGIFQYSYKERLYHSDDEETGCEENMEPIPVRLVRLMGGELCMEEDSSKRRYYFVIPQGHITNEPLIKPLESKRCILFYENTVLQSNAFARTLRMMQLDFCQVSDNEEFYAECIKECYTHILIASERYDAMKDKLERLLSPQSLVLIGSNFFSYDDVLIRTTFARPVNCLNLEALLCNRKNSTIRHVGYKGGFICPDAKVMVVDDNIVNLEVATSILNRYKAQVLVAVSGRECLNMLQQERVDFIFLDYMMPEMDGIDTLKNIRALEIPGLDEVPVVALTANAVSGAREMFLDAGFNEYISKPIELDKFEKVLCSYLPEDKIVYITNKDDKSGET